MVLDHLEDRSSYGRLRLWGQMGFGLGSTAVGFLLSHSKENDVPSIEPSVSSPTMAPAFVEAISSLPIQLQQAIEYADHFWQNLTGYKLLFLNYAMLSIPAYMCIQAFKKLD